MKLNIFLAVFMSSLICLKAEICRDTIDKITQVLESDDSITEQVIPSIDIEELTFIRFYYF